MVYKYFTAENYENFASGRVIYHRAGFSNYPTRLAGELFYRCLEYSKVKENICLYDPCCGGSYMATTLGFLCNEVIERIYCSDILTEAVKLSLKNLALLTRGGLARRRIEIENQIKMYSKKSHTEALESLEKIECYVRREIQANVFLSDVLNGSEIANQDFMADIVMTDVPYGSLVNWHGGGNGEELDGLLKGIQPVTTTNTVIAISYNKKHKMKINEHEIIERINVGHRKIVIIKCKK